MTVSLEMVIPGVAGFGVDRKLGTTPILTVVGFGLGMALGMLHLLRMTSPPERNKTKSARENR